MLQRLRSLAADSSMQNKHSAAIFSGGKILSIGKNDHDCHRDCRNQTRYPSTHAEVAAIRGLSKLYWEKSHWVLQR
jgi:hypothetical protein